MQPIRLMKKRFATSASLASVGLVTASPAFAQTVPEHGVFILNSVLFLLCGCSSMVER